MQELPASFGALANYKQFILYIKKPRINNPAKTDKIPVDAAGNPIDPHLSVNWMSAIDTITMVKMLGEPYGVGFVFTSHDPFFFVDIDGCVIDGNWSPVAMDLLTRFNGAAVEVSQSGTGLHIIGSYNGFEPEHGCTNKALGLELYTSGRFVALTGLQVSGNAAVDHVLTLNNVINQYFPFDPNTIPNSVNWTTTHAENSTPIEDDDKLIKKMLASHSTAGIFGNKATVQDLWNANVEILGKFYPDNTNNRQFDASAADSALAQHLHFWTGGNCERVDRLMRRSKLVRPKWDEHKSYMQRTITATRARQTKFYFIDKTPPQIINPTSLNEPSGFRHGHQIMTPDQQLLYFKDFVYVAEINQIFTTNGSCLGSERFNAMYGGYSFIIDLEEGKTTVKPWDAFTQNQAVSFPKADAFTFRPDMAPGEIVYSEGFKYVNTYVPVNVEMINDNVEPFLIHLAKVLPDPRDQTILLSYMAACVQFKGFKIKWAPLLQGVEGNGKTLFTLCVQYAVGERYTHMPPAQEIAEKFNSWLFNTLFIGVEDIYVPGEKREVIETLKPMITSTRLARRAMQTDQMMHNVCCNFMFNSNHRDAIKKTKNDRRYAVFYTAQQKVSDLDLSGMGGDYFPNLYNWLNDDNGFAKVAHFLNFFSIPDEFNPKTKCQRAPITSTTNAVIKMSQGVVEQEITEAIEEGKQGFANGWVSSFALDKLLDNMRRSNSIPRNKRRGIMQDLGYDLHPGLKDGRVNAPLLFEDGKPRLYIRTDHPDVMLTNPNDIVLKYRVAQGDPLVSNLPIDIPVNKV